MAVATNYVALFRRVLAMTDRYLDGHSRVLDFGCGAGETVYQFLDAEFDARGFDIHDYLELRSPQDRKFFSIANDGIQDHSIMSIDWGRYRLPYDDGTFDFVFSSQTMEHVLNLEAVIRELARVTKPDGIGIHIFPPRYKTLESHTFVPFGGISKSFLYNLLWTSVGVRNDFSRHCSAVEAAKRNARYARTGTNYPPIRDIQKLGQKYFEIARFRPDLWHMAWGSPGRYGWRMTRPALLAYTMFNEIVWVLERPIPPATDGAPSARSQE